MRLPAAVTILAALLLSGCLAAKPAAVQATPAADDGVVVTAVRVQAHDEPFDVLGAFQLRGCARDSCTTGTAPRLTDAAWVGWDPVVLDFGDPAALFWRVAAKAEWSGPNTVDEVVLSVAVTTPCGIACVTEREVGHAVGARPLGSGEAPVGPLLETFDVYLEPGETGIRVRFDIASGHPGIGPAQLDYHLQGQVSAYRAAGEPFVVA